MSDSLKQLLEKAGEAQRTQDAATIEERQRVSFVYGSLNIEDPEITEESVIRASREMRRKETEYATAEQSGSRDATSPAPR